MSDPTARGDAVASEVRNWYEANCETWWQRHMPVLLGGNRNMHKIAADNFMLRLIEAVRRATEKAKR